MKLCIDCKHHRKNDATLDPERALCAKFFTVVETISPVTGNIVPGEWFYCDLARKPCGPCGPEAFGFEPREGVTQ